MPVAARRRHSDSDRHHRPRRPEPGGPRGGGPEDSGAAGPNTSVGVGVVAELAARAALVLGASYDVEIFEAHHRLKRDAPSGTALALGEAIAAARGQRLDEAAVYERTGQSAARGRRPSAFRASERAISSANTRSSSPATESASKSPTAPPTARSSRAARCGRPDGWWGGRGPVRHEGRARF